MNTNGSNGANGKAEWIEIRDASGKLLFKYDPAHNVIELKQKNSDAYVLIRLDEIRLKHGYTPVDMSIVFVREYVTVDHVHEQANKPYSESKK